jgi:hypothetical protein
MYDEHTTMNMMAGVVDSLQKQLEHQLELHRDVFEKTIREIVSDEVRKALKDCGMDKHSALASAPLTPSSTPAQEPPLTPTPAPASTTAAAVVAPRTLAQAPKPAAVAPTKK